MYTFRTQFMAIHFHYLLPLLRCPRHRPHFLDGTAHIEYVEYLTRSFLHHTITTNTQLITITMSLLQIPQALRLPYTCLLIHPITHHLRSQLILYAYAFTDTISQHREWFIKDIDGVSHFRPPPNPPSPSHPIPPTSTPKSAPLSFSAHSSNWCTKNYTPFTRQSAWRSPDPQIHYTPSAAILLLPTIPLTLTPTSSTSIITYA